jgi:hypothetical protein
MAFDLGNYETVEDRLARFWTDHPNGRINSELVVQDGDQVIFKAAVYFDAADPIPRATGYAEELRGSSPVNKTSHLENCETSAIGRALANCGYSTRGKRASREEMTKVARMTGEAPSERSEGRSAPGSAAARPGGFASSRQLGFIKKLAKDRGLDDLATLEALHELLDDTAVVLETLTSQQASRIIEAWK